MGPQFFQTPMGRTFYEGTMPRLVEALTRLWAALVPDDEEAVLARQDVGRLDPPEGDGWRVRQFQVGPGQLLVLWVRRKP